MIRYTEKIYRVNSAILSFTQKMQYYRQQMFPDMSDILMNALYIFVFQPCHTMLSTRNINQRNVPTEALIVILIKPKLSPTNTILNYILNNNK